MLCCRILLPHIKSVLNEHGQDTEDSLRLEALLERASDHIYHTGDYSRAEIYSQKCPMIRTWILGDSHNDTIQAMDDLAHIYRVFGQMDKAETLQLRAIENYGNKSDKNGPLLFILVGTRDYTTGARALARGRRDIYSAYRRTWKSESRTTIRCGIHHVTSKPT